MAWYGRTFVGQYLKFLNKSQTRTYIIYFRNLQVVSLKDNILKNNNRSKPQQYPLKTINEEVINHTKRQKIYQQQEADMDSLIDYLQFVKKSLENINNQEYIHLVIGNESCDIDSSVSTIVLAYFLHMHRNSNIPKEALVVPIQNESQENFPIHTENCYLYKEIGLPLDLLVYRDQINFGELVKSKKVTTSLVDHHILSENCKELEETVVQIFDHRPKDSAFNWDENKVEIIIEQVGSCATLIADRMLSLAENLLFRELGYLIHATIIFDTQGLSDKTKRAKELDFKIIDALENKFSFNISPKDKFEVIWKVHNDVSHLTPKQILIKDLKMVQGVPVCGLPMLVQDFIKLQDCCDTLRKYLDEHSTLLVLVGLDSSNGIKRDIALFYDSAGEHFAGKITDLLCNCRTNKGYDFELTEVKVNIPFLKCFNQGNVGLSRKQIIPVIVEAGELISAPQ